ncbi:elongation factor P maturation arginine rhamnosyltransferase EarP [Pseudomonas mangiferae]|uniref:Protein-arginine rhamnosyltransferase n=1 Tax=Pseudomonas mangiferae TaxID=2593654 RepID=A0A553H4W4_9PSED|nr:elongation factor P maturation arginine rhamnosyltransferase EarP [Pseudomonas mangiferae]TRX76819.1 elongation factor P maturation arginine rhamnosyltransferase EarP [Pseudomonas mangiferae]
MSVTVSAQWDIFCRVVDNYGDVGVTWRLARQLVAEQGLRVRLWIDEPAAFQRLCPTADPAAPAQTIQGVEVRQWQPAWTATEPADVVIEAFACELPAPYRQAMVLRARPPVWINLDYLSAEDWVEGCHGLPSLQDNGLRKFFFFPGFTADTGGLLRERDLVARRRAFQADASCRLAFLQGLGVPVREGVRLVSLFAYENADLAGWLEALADDDRRPTCLLVPEGRVLADVDAWLGCRSQAGDHHRRGALEVCVLPFLAQDDYDRLLWCCDLNAVRGEDSFLRAQWAGRPLLWHIYPQADDAHWDKLDAFLARYDEALPAELAEASRAFWYGWNRGEGAGAAWAGVAGQLDRLRDHAEAWCERLIQRPDLATALAAFAARAAA